MPPPSMRQSPRMSRGLGSDAASPRNGSNAIVPARLSGAHRQELKAVISVSDYRQWFAIGWAA